MELKWLEDFLSLAETRSFSRSAEERRVTQPAFSRRIRSLEVWLGAVLLDRSTYPITLTPEGPAFPRDRGGGGARAAPQPRRVPRRRCAADDADDRGHRAAHAGLTFLPRWLTGLRAAARAGGEPGAARQFPYLRAGAGRGRLRLPADLPSSRRADPARPRALSASGGRPRQPRRRGAARTWRTRTASALPLAAVFARLVPRPAGRDRPGAGRRAATFLAHTNENSMAEALKFMALEGHGVAWLPRSLVAARSPPARWSSSRPSCRWTSASTAAPSARGRSSTGSGPPRVARCRNGIDPADHGI